MKRVCCGVLMVLAVLAAAYAGQTMFPWASEELRKPCGKTILEWQIATNNMRPAAPQKLTTEFDVVQMVAMPKPRGLVVRMNLTRRPGVRFAPGDKNWHYKVHGLPATAANFVRRTYKMSDAFEDMRNLYLLISIDGELTVLGTFRNIVALPDNPTPQQQASALAKLLGE